MKALSLILVCAVLLGAIGANAQSARDYVPGRLILQLEDGVTPKVAKSGEQTVTGVSDLDAQLGRFSIERMEQLYAGIKHPEKAGDVDPLQYYTIDFPVHHDLDLASAEFLQLASVKAVWKDELLPIDWVPNDPGLSSQWYLRNTIMGGKDVRALGGWAEARGDSNIVIAVIDSGVDYTHEDLGGTHPEHLNGAIFTNWAEYYGNPGQDDDGNGKIDDVRGWDYVNLSQSQGFPDEDMTVQDNDPMDYGGHGTNCAGIIAAVTDNGIGIAGISPGSKILPVRAGYLASADTVGYVVMSYASSGIIYSADTGADIISMSFGGSTFLNFALDYATSQGVINVHSAGNDDAIVSGSGIDGRSDVLTVAATDQYDFKAGFSNYGVNVDISAPGVGIYTTNLDRITGPGYVSTQGTSFSGPAVAGCAALIWSANPGWSRSQVWNHLLSTCDDIDAVNPGYVNQMGAGRPNMLRALGDSFLEISTEFDFLFDAMNSAADGDTIALKASEAMSGPVEIAARNVYILGGWDESFSTRDALGTPTVITANAGNTALQFAAGATTATVVDGFRCTGGGGKFFNGIPDTGDFGGGIILNGTSPTLRNIDVTANSTGGFSEFGGGGGILMRNSDSVLENVHVHGNTSIYGAGLYISGGSPTLIDCVIEDNVSLITNPTYSPYGGGIYVHGANLTMSGSTISGHNDVDFGGGIYADCAPGGFSLTLDHNLITDNEAKSGGGGVYTTFCDLSMLGDEISNNTTTAAATFMNGGGVYAVNGDATLDSVVVRGNYAQVGGGVFLSSDTFSLTNSVIADNEAVYFGGGTNIQSNGAMTGNTVVGNHAGSASGGVYLQNATATLSNNLVAFNTGSATSANGVNAVGGAPTFTCNDVWSNDGDQYGNVTDPTGTDGNISEDPLFCDYAAGDYTLTDTSPCDPDNAGVCGQIGAFDQGCTGGTAVDDGPGASQVPLAFKVEPNYPNPFNPSTTISFALPTKSHVSIRIYDVAGRLVKTLVDEVRDPAVYDVIWAGQDDRGRQVSSGVYFYHVRTDDEEFVDRMALLK